MGEDNDDRIDPSRRTDEQTLPIDQRVIEARLQADSADHRARDAGGAGSAADTRRMPAVDGPTLPVPMPPQLIAQSRAGWSPSGVEEPATTPLPGSVSFEARVEADGRLRIPDTILERRKLVPGAVLRITAWVVDEL